MSLHSSHRPTHSILFVLLHTSDSNCNRNFDEISELPPRPPPVLTHERSSNSHHRAYDREQSKRKNMLIDELKSFFANRSSDGPREEQSLHSESPLTCPRASSVRQHDLERPSTALNFRRVFNDEQLRPRLMDQSTSDLEGLFDVTHSKSSSLVQSCPLNVSAASTAVLASISLLSSVLLSTHSLGFSEKLSRTLDLFTDTLIHLTSFSLGRFGARYVRQTTLPRIQGFGQMLTSSLLLHVLLNTVAGDRHLQRHHRVAQKIVSVTSTSMIPTCPLFTRQDMLTRLITSTLHLIAGFTFHSGDKHVT